MNTRFVANTAGVKGGAVDWDSIVDSISTARAWAFIINVTADSNAVLSTRSSPASASTVPSASASSSSDVGQFFSVTGSKKLHMSLVRSLVINNSVLVTGGAGILINDTVREDKEERRRNEKG
jgi:hypothetical protein